MMLAAFKLVCVHVRQCFGLFSFGFLADFKITSVGRYRDGYRNPVFNRSRG